MRAIDGQPADLYSVKAMTASGSMASHIRISPDARAAQHLSKCGIAQRFAGTCTTL